MSCTSPLWRLPMPQGRAVVKSFLEKPDPYVDQASGELVEPHLLPCGQCRSCRIAHAREWANRCVMESITAKKGQSWFLTVTYDDDHLPTIGDALRPSLYPKDMEKFWHDLRQYYERKHSVVGIRYYYAGEYGDQTARPHYHVLVYNLPIFDLKPYKVTYNHDDLFTSQTLSQIWGKGYVVIGELTWNSACYTARYTMKKLNGIAAESYVDAGIMPEFQRCSNRPGIGSEYYNLYKDKIYRLDQITLPSPSKDRSLIVKPPKAFDRKLKEEIELGNVSELLQRSYWDAKKNRLVCSENSQLADDSILGYDLLERFELIDYELERKFKSYGRDEWSKD